MNPRHETQAQPTPLQWCDDCDRYIDEHPLIHQINRHAPIIGPKVKGNTNWRTAELKVAS